MKFDLSKGLGAAAAWLAGCAPPGSPASLFSEQRAALVNAANNAERALEAGLEAYAQTAADAFFAGLPMGPEIEELAEPIAIRLAAKLADKFPAVRDALAKAPPATPTPPAAPVAGQ